MIKKLLLTTLFVFSFLSAGFCAKISTLTDDFNDNSLDTTTKWTTASANGFTIAETNGEIELTSVITSSYAWVQLISKTTYDLTGSQATLKIVDYNSTAVPDGNLMFFVRDTVEDVDVGWIIEDGIIYLTDGYSSFDSDTYVANTYRYLKLRESGGTTYWDYSSDGITWTNFNSKANPATLTSVTGRVWFQTWSTEASTTTAKVDDFNILPSATRRIIFIQ